VLPKAPADTPSAGKKAVPVDGCERGIDITAAAKHCLQGSRWRRFLGLNSVQSEQVAEYVDGTVDNRLHASTIAPLVKRDVMVTELRISAVTFSFRLFLAQAVGLFIAPITYVTMLIGWFALLYGAGWLGVIAACQVAYALDFVLLQRRYWRTFHTRGDPHYAEHTFFFVPGLGIPILGSMRTRMFLRVSNHHTAQILSERPDLKPDRAQCAAACATYFVRLSGLAIADHRVERLAFDTGLALQMLIQHRNFRAAALQGILTLQGGL
jgi:hypothetical protein